MNPETKRNANKNLPWWHETHQGKWWMSFLDQNRCQTEMFGMVNHLLGWLIQYLICLSQWSQPNAHHQILKKITFGNSLWMFFLVKLGGWIFVLDVFFFASFQVFQVTLCVSSCNHALFHLSPWKLHPRAVSACVSCATSLSFSNFLGSKDSSWMYPDPYQRGPPSWEIPTWMSQEVSKWLVSGL